jgi:hypothetical protein
MGSSSNYSSLLSYQMQLGFRETYLLDRIVAMQEEGMEMELVEWILMGDLKQTGITPTHSLVVGLIIRWKL